jgi:hypothetical protein
MNVIISGYRYKVWDANDPAKHRYLVSKGRRCSCGIVKCEHVKAVSEYLQRGGKRAPDEPYDTRGTLEAQLERIRALRERRIEEKALGMGTVAILEAQRASGEAEREEWLRAYSLPQQWPAGMVSE